MGRISIGKWKDGDLGKKRKKSEGITDREVGRVEKNRS